MALDQSRWRGSGRFVMLAMGAGLLAVLPGCGGGDAPSQTAGTQREPAADDSGERRASRPDADAPPAAGDSDASENLVRTDADGRKWIDDIPLDVWFDDPVETFRTNAQITAGPTPSEPAASDEPGAGTPSETTVPPAESPTASDPPAPDGTDWGELIAGQVLDAEAKSLRNQLTTAMQTVATYNNSFQAIQWDGATLCAVAGIAIEHPDPLGWKDDAPQIRNLAQKIEEAAQERGRSSFEATQIPFEQMIAVFSGNEPAGLEPADPAVPFAESASRAGMMRRMQESFDWLSKNINSADRLSDPGNKDQLILETSLLAAFTTVISTDGYDSAGEPDYAQEAQSLVQDALDARSAAQAGSYDAYREAVDRMGTRCGNCHGKYRFSE